MADNALRALDPTGTLASHRTMSTGKQNFDALTGLRFFAAMAVVIYHFGSTLALQWLAPIANVAHSGFVAVSFFYVLSGFVLSYSYVGPSGVMQGSRRSFWVARLARIYPAYLLAFVLAAPTNVIWSLSVNSVGTAIAKLAVGAISVLTLQQAWTPWSAWYWNYPAWSVSVEAFFYLCFPLLVSAIAKIRKRHLLPVMSALWLIGLVLPVVVSTVHQAPTSGNDRLAMAVEFTPLFRLPEFLVGVLLARLHAGGVRLRSKWSSISTYLLAGAVVLTLAIGGRAIPKLILSNGLLVPLFALLIMSLAEGKTLAAKGLSWAPLVLLGEASYGIYILQIPVSYVFRMPPPLQSVGILAAYLTLLIGVALLSWRFVEAPLRLRIRRWLLKPEPLRELTSIRAETAVAYVSSRTELES